MMGKGLLTEPRDSIRSKLGRFGELLNVVSKWIGIFNPKTTTRADSHLPKGTEIIGTLFFEGPVVINGHVEGDITAKDRVTVHENGVVEADKINAASVVIAGVVKVNTIVSSLIEILSSGKVSGDLASPILNIHEGAQVEGNIRAREKPKDSGALVPAQNPNSEVTMPALSSWGLARASDANRG